MNTQLDGNETDLAAYYTFDERTGDTVVDFASGEYNGTIEGNVTRLNFLGDGLDFDGVTSYVDLGNTNDIKPSDELTVSLWFDYNGTVSATSDSLISNYDSYGYAIDLFSTGYLRAVVHNGTAAQTAEYAQSSLNTGWNHATLTYDQTNGLLLYVNGEQVAQNTNTGTLSHSTSNTFIGAEASGSTIDTTRMFNGRIAQVSIWDTALTQSEVQEVMHGSLNGDESGLLGYWPLDEGEGNVSYDYSANANHGDITSAEWNTTAPDIYGENLYTTAGITVSGKVVMENNVSAVTYTLGSSTDGMEVNSSTGRFVYTPAAGTVNETIDLNATDGTNDAGLSLRSLVLPVTVSIDLSDLDLSETDVTAITLVGQDDLEQNISVDVSGLADGENNLTASIYGVDQNYSMLVETSDGNQWWVNFADNTLDLTNDGSDDYMTTLEDGSEISLSLDSDSWNGAKLLLQAHGGALQFLDSSVDGNFQAPIDETLSQFTIEWWMQPAEYITTGNRLGTEWGTFMFHEDGSGGIYVGVDDTERLDPSDLPSGTMTLNEWQHFVYTFSGSVEKFYRNGVLLAEKTGLTVAPSDWLDFRAGLTNSTNAAENSSYSIDEIRLWSTVRTSSEINASMNQQLDGNETGLVAYYTFDERIGDRVVDFASGEYNGTIEGNVTRLNFLGDGLAFDGTLQYVDLGTSDLIANETEITTAAWIRLDSYPDSPNMADILYKKYIHAMAVSSTGYLYFSKGDASAWISGVYSDSNLSLDRWYHVAATHDTTSDTTKLYVDGELVSESSGDSEVYDSFESNTTTSTVIGNGKDTGYNDINGSIAQVSLWNRVLTQSEIRTLMLSAPDVGDADLRGYWPLDEGSGSAAYDYSSNANHGTISGAEWNNTAPEIYGANLYAVAGMTVIGKVEMDNDPASASFSLGSSSDDLEINASTGRFVYTPSYGTVSDTIDLNATDGINSAGLSLRTTVVLAALPVNLSDVNLSDHNLSKLVFVGDDGNVTIDLSGLDDGDNNLTGAFYALDVNYSVYAETNDSGTVSGWWYNEDKGAFYDTLTDHDGFNIYVDSDGSAIGLAAGSSGNWETPATNLSVSPASLSLGSIPTGDGATGTFTVTNSGTETVTFSLFWYSYNLAGDYNISSDCSTLAVGGDCTVVVGATPSADGDLNMTIKLYSDDILYPEYGLTLSATAYTSTSTSQVDGTIYLEEEANISSITMVLFEVNATDLSYTASTTARAEDDTNTSFTYAFTGVDAGDYWVALYDSNETFESLGIYGTDYNGQKILFAGYDTEDDGNRTLYYDKATDDDGNYSNTFDVNGTSGATLNLAPYPASDVNLTFTLGGDTDALSGMTLAGYIEDDNDSETIATFHTETLSGAPTELNSDYPDANQTMVVMAYTKTDLGDTIEKRKLLLYTKEEATGTITDTVTGEIGELNLTVTDVGDISTIGYYVNDGAGNSTWTGGLVYEEDTGTAVTERNATMVLFMESNATLVVTYQDGNKSWYDGTGWSASYATFSLAAGTDLGEIPDYDDLFGALTISPAYYTFDTAIGEEENATFTLANEGNGTLTLYGYGLYSYSGSIGDYNLTGECNDTIGSGASCTLTLNYKPTTAEGNLAYLIIYSDDPDRSYHTVTIAANYRTVSGYVLLPDNDTADENITVEVLARSNALTYVDTVTIEQGNNSAEYNLSIYETAFGGTDLLLGYRITEGKEEQHLLAGYYVDGDQATTKESSADTIDVNGSLTDINITLARGDTWISGTLSLPATESALDADYIVGVGVLDDDGEVYAGQEYDFNTSVTAIDYNISVIYDEMPTLRLGYQFNETAFPDGYYRSAYYNGGGTSDPFVYQLLTLTGEEQNLTDVNFELLQSDGSYDVTLSPGWNLVSLPAGGEVNASGIDRLLDDDDLAYLMRYNPLSGWSYYWLDESYYDATADRFTSLSGNDGFYVYNSGGNDVTVQLAVKGESFIDTVPDVYAGWNLVGYPEDVTPSALIGAIESKSGLSVVILWVYRSGSWTVYLPGASSSLVSPTPWISTINASEGIWVKAK